MATEGNEYRQRQQQRAEARKKREHAQNMTMIRLGIALAVILVVGLTIFLVTRDGRQPGEPTSNKPSTPVISNQPT